MSRLITFTLLRARIADRAARLSVTQISIIFFFVVVAYACLGAWLTWVFE